MINYNPKDWFSLIFRFHRSDTFRVLWPAMLCIGLYAGLVAYLEMAVWEPPRKSSSVMHSLLGFVISLMLVFRTNTAYERWSEGRKLWGTLVNCSRNLVMQTRAFVPPAQRTSHHYVATLVGNYAYALKNHLRDRPDPGELEADGPFQPRETDAPPHWPNYLAHCLYRELARLHQQGHLGDAQLLVLNGELRQFTDVCGACERIKRTPIPYSYSLFLKKFLFVYVMTMPFGFIYDFGYWITLIVVFVFYVLASLELIAEEIEQPFGRDQNDLPLDELAANIRRNARELSSVDGE
ncbi:MAG: bestrophin family protein [Ferruginibacter sp.]|nr:bestrophin family protein [Cytophagales bacterium]